MRTDLDHLSKQRQRDIEKICHAIRVSFDRYTEAGTQPWRRAGRIEKIILFGSYATGSWTDDFGNYLSDYDLLVVVNSPKLVEVDFWWELGDLFLHRLKEWKPEVNIIVHDLAEVNNRLSEGHYFFTDIWEEGIQLFSRAGSKPLVTPKPEAIPQEVALKWARQHFETMFPKATEFFAHYEFALSRDQHKMAAFMLHQTFESAYACALLVQTNYVPATHNLKHLRSLVEPLHEDFVKVWLTGSRLQSRAFQRIKRAYVEARYSPHFDITEEELRWAADRAQFLMQEVVEPLCKKRLALLGA